MSKRKLLSALIAGLFASAPALAQVQSGDTLFTGSVSIGGLGTDVNDAKDKGARLEEYRDLSNGVLGVIDVKARNSANKGWADLYLENIGRDDFYGSIRGGQYGVWKGRFYSDWLRHRFVDDALSPYNGLGTNALRGTFPNLDPSTWNHFDVNYTRKDTGGYFEWQSLSPWYFRVDGNSVKTEGTKLLASSLGTSPTNGFVDLIAPVDWTTDTWTAEGGYNTRKMHVAVAYTHSKFDNSNETLTWTNPFFSNGIDTTYLPPNNETDRVTANATFRELPYSSTFATRFTWMELTSDANVGTSVLNTGNTFAATQPSENTFHGKIQNTTFTAALASTPMKALDTRLYYNYYRRKNDSSDVFFTGSSVGCSVDAPCEGIRFGYTKNNVGFDAYWKVAAGHRLGFGWDYLDTNRDGREDYDGSRDNKLFVEYKNTQLDTLVARIKYTYLQRRSDFLRGDEGVDANDPLYMERFVARFDVQSVDQNNVKLQLDWSPMPLLDLSFEYNWKDNDYKGFPTTVAADPVGDLLGRKKDNRDEIYAAAYFGDPKVVRFTAYGDWENIRYESYHRNIGAGGCTTATGPNCFDPTRPPNSTAFNWYAKNKDRNESYGLAMDWPAMDRLLVKASYLYVKTDGSADLTSQNNYGNPLPITAYDDTTKQSLNLKGIYSVNKNWSVTAGYSYEKYDYSDQRYDGYRYVLPASSNQNSYLSGYNAFSPYKANIFYGLVTYRF